MVTKRKNFKSKDEESSWTEKVAQVNRVTKVVKGGKKLSFRAVIIVGNEKGQVGVGIGKATDVIGAVKKGVANAKKHIVSVPLTKNYSIPHQINGGAGAAQVLIRPSAPGSGVIAGGAVRTVLELAGIQNILSKQLGSNNVLNNARATIDALANLRTFEQAATDRSVSIFKLYNSTDASLM